MPRRNRKRQSRQAPRGHKASRGNGLGEASVKQQRAIEFLDRSWQPGVPFHRRGG